MRIARCLLARSRRLFASDSCGRSRPDRAHTRNLAQRSGAPESNCRAGCHTEQALEVLWGYRASPHDPGFWRHSKSSRPMDHARHRSRPPCRLGGNQKVASRWGREPGLRRTQRVFKNLCGPAPAPPRTRLGGYVDRALPHRVNIRGAAITRNECIRRRLDALNRTGFGGNPSSQDAVWGEEDPDEPACGKSVEHGGAACHVGSARWKSRSR